MWEIAIIGASVWWTLGMPTEHFLDEIVLVGTNAVQLTGRSPRRGPSSAPYGVPASVPLAHACIAPDRETAPAPGANKCRSVEPAHNSTSTVMKTASIAALLVITVTMPAPTSTVTRTPAILRHVPGFDTVTDSPATAHATKPSTSPVAATPRASAMNPAAEPPTTSMYKTAIVATISVAMTSLTTLIVAPP